MEAVRVEELIYSCMLAEPSRRRERLEDICTSYPEVADAVRTQFERLLRLGLVSLGGDSPSAAFEPALPSSLGPYRIDGILGRGGVGIVYRGRQSNLGDRPVAVKALRPELLGSTRGQARFVREGLLAARLRHPNLCPVLDVGNDNGIAWLAMPLIEGETLAARIEWTRERSACGPVRLRDHDDADWHAVVRLIATVARALHRAHQTGLVHRDIKPANIVVQPDGEPVLLDFGLARDLADERSGLTGSAELLGTPAYMAPEQAEPHRRGTDARTDVYGLGATLHECLTLRLPHEGATRNELLQKIAREPATPLRRHGVGLPAELETVVIVALDRDPDRRYATAAAFARDLEHVLRNEPILARSPGRLLRTLRWVGRNRLAAAFIVVLGLGLVSSLALSAEVRIESAGRQVTALLARADANRAEARSFEAFGDALEARRLDPRSPTTLASLQQLLGRELEVIRFETPFGGFGITDPTGDRMAFPVQGGLEIQRMSADAGPPLEFPGVFLVRMAWTADGGIVAADPDGFVQRSDPDGRIGWRSDHALAGDAASERLPSALPRQVRMIGVATRPAHDGEPELVAVGTPSGVIHLLDASTGRPADGHGDLRIDAHRILELQFVPDEPALLCNALGDHAFEAWLVPLDGGPPRRLTRRAAWISTLQAERGHWIAYSSGARRLEVGDLHDGGGASQGESELPTLARSGKVRAAALHGDLVAVAAADRVLVFDAAEALAGAAHRLELQHRGAVSGVAFDPDGATLVTSTSDGLVQRFDLVTGKPIAVLMQSPSSELLGVEVTPAGDVLAAADSRQVHVVRRPPPPYARVTSGDWYSQLVPVWDGDDRLLVSHVGSATTEILDACGRSLRTMENRGPRHEIETARLVAGEPPTPVIFGTNKEQDVFVHVDPHTGQALASVPLPVPRKRSLIGAWISRDGRRLLALCEQSPGAVAHVTSLARSGDAADWHVDAEAVQNEHFVRHACILNDGDAVYACTDGELRLAEPDLATSRRVWRHPAGGALRFVAPRPDQRTVLVGCEDGLVALVDLASGHARLLRGHTASVTFTAFSKDASLAATGDATGEIALWSLPRGELVCRWRAHDQRVRHLAFAPSGDRLVSSGYDGAVAVWPVDPAVIEALARARAPRRVTVGARAR